MPTDVEVLQARQLTQALIDREPSVITITRPSPDTLDGAGGRIRGAEPLTIEPQRVFVSGVTRDSDYRQSSFSQSNTGESFTNRIVIVGMPDLDINQYDEFDWKGYRVKVLFRHPDNGYEVRAEAERVTAGGR